MCVYFAQGQLEGKDEGKGENKRIGRGREKQGNEQSVGTITKREVKCIDGLKSTT